MTVQTMIVICPVVFLPTKRKKEKKKKPPVFCWNSDPVLGVNFCPLWLLFAVYTGSLEL